LCLVTRLIEWEVSMADQLATPEDLASVLQQDLDRATAELLIECATAVVQSAAGRQRILQVVDDTETIYLDSYDTTTWLELPQRPVTDVSAVSIGGTAVSDWTPQLSRGRLFRTYGWRAAAVNDPLTPSSVEVTYTHGYPADSQHLQLARSVTLMLAKTAYANPDGVLNEKIDDYSVTYEKAVSSMELSPFLKQALRRQYGPPARSARLVLG
jgi:hypothetical protein